MNFVPALQPQHENGKFVKYQISNVRKRFFKTTTRRCTKKRQFLDYIGSAIKQHCQKMTSSSLLKHFMIQLLNL